MQPEGNAPPGPAANPPVQVGRGGAETGVRAGGGGGGGGENPPQTPPGPPIGPNPPNPTNFSLTPGGENLGVLYYSTKKRYHYYTGVPAKLEEVLYNCTTDGFHQLIKILKVQSESYKWTSNENIFWLAQAAGKTT